MNNEIIQAYMKLIQSGEKLDPVRIRPSDPLYRVIDGNHRAAAYKKLGMDIPTVPFLTKSAGQLFGKDTKRTVYKTE